MTWWVILFLSPHCLHCVNSVPYYRVILILRFKIIKQNSPTLNLPMSNISNQKYASGFSKCSRFYGTNRLFLGTRSFLRVRSSGCMHLVRGERTDDSLTECLCWVISSTNSGKGWLLASWADFRGEGQQRGQSQFCRFAVLFSVWSWLVCVVAYKQGNCVRGELNTLLSNRIQSTLDRLLH